MPAITCNSFSNNEFIIHYNFQYSGIYPVGLHRASWFYQTGWCGGKRISKLPRERSRKIFPQLDWDLQSHDHWKGGWIMVWLSGMKTNASFTVGNYDGNFRCTVSDFRSNLKISHRFDSIGLCLFCHSSFTKNRRKIEVTNAIPHYERTLTNLMFPSLHVVVKITHVI